MLLARSRHASVRSLELYVGPASTLSPGTSRSATPLPVAGAEPGTSTVRARQLSAERCHFPSRVGCGEGAGLGAAGRREKAETAETAPNCQAAEYNSSATANEAPALLAAPVNTPSARVPHGAWTLLEG